MARASGRAHTSLTTFKQLDIRDRTHARRAAKGNSINDSLDVPLVDRELLDELELTTNLTIAATASTGSLHPHQVDRILGLAPPTNSCEGEAR
jgi:hypothetical protein